MTTSTSVIHIGNIKPDKKSKKPKKTKKREMTKPSDKKGLVYKPRMQ